MYDNVIAMYDYVDARGRLVKQVIRSHDEHGNKRFRQRKWTDSGWIENVKGIGPVLYNAHRIGTAGTVVIVEGEKDADSITNLHLDGYGGDSIGVTSGESRSWHHKLAKQLRNKVVIVMPDNDAADTPNQASRIDVFRPYRQVSHSVRGAPAHLG